MVWKPKKARWNWRAYLTPKEAAAIQDGDVMLAKIALLRQDVRQTGRAHIINRAIQRAKQDARS